MVNKTKKMELNRVKLQMDTPENGKELLNKIQDVVDGKILPPSEPAKEA